MSDSNDISIGVVVPAYRSAGTVAATLDALAAQTVAPTDAIVVVDGPDPATEAAVRDHSSGIEVVTLPVNTGGPAGPRNEGAARLRDRRSLDAIWFLDADDVPDPRFIEVVRDLLKRDPDVDLVATRFRKWRTGERPPMRDDVLDRPPRRLDLDWYLSNTGSLLPSFSVLRTRILDRVRSGQASFAVDLRINQDYDLFVRAIQLGKAVAIAWSGGTYRLHEGGISANATATWLCRLTADEGLARWFEAEENHALAARFRRAAGSSARRAARHLWRRRLSGDRAVALRLLLDDLAGRRDPRSFATLAMLALGLDRRAGSSSRRSDRTAS